MKEIKQPFGLLFCSLPSAKDMPKRNNTNKHRFFNMLNFKDKDMVSR